MITYYLSAIVALLFVGWLIVTGLDRRDARRKAAQDKALDAAIEAERACPMTLAMDDPTEPEEEGNLVQIGDHVHHIAPHAELVDGLPVRAQAIEVPREGAVLQGRWRPHTRCVDAWADREPSRICRDCAPVFGRTAVEA